MNGVAPRVTLVTTMKDEAPYILDWIAHYKTLGVSDFVVFTNDCTDQTDQILRILNRMGIVQHRFNNVLRRGPHKSALKWAQTEPAVSRADWIFVADVDEYLSISSSDGTLTGLIRDHPNVDAISFVWRIFGNAGVDRMLDAPVPLQFSAAEKAQGGPNQKRMFKTMYRNCEKFARLGVHRPFLAEGAEDIRWILPDGRAFSEEQVNKGLAIRPPYGYEAAQLNHYALRSLDGFLNKRARGRANHHTQTIEADYWNKFDKNAEQDLGLAQSFDKAIQVKELLLQNSELRQLHLEAVATHQKRARMARKSDAMKAVLQTLGRLPEDAAAAD